MLVYRKLPQQLKDANALVHAHIIALSKQALATIKELKPYTGKGDYLFPSVSGDYVVITPNKPYFYSMHLFIRISLFNLKTVVSSMDYFKNKFSYEYYPPNRC